MTKNEPPPEGRSLDALHEPALGLGLKLDAGAVRDHRAAFDAKRFTRRQDASGNRERWVVAKMYLHARR